jgi:rare lipoprotein A (peptidoglycan hydrolase)
MNRRGWALWLLCGTLWLQGCVTGKPHNSEEDLRDRGHVGGDRDAGAHKLSGGASWYGERFHGRSTACGEPFDMYAFTAAHRSLPFHTVVRVTDPDTRKSVVVRINDRGPYDRDRVIDLSWAAARDLDMVERGVIEVELEVLTWGDGKRCR